MNSAISPDESTRPDDSKTLLFVPAPPPPPPPLGLELLYAGRYELSNFKALSLMIPKLFCT